MIPQDTIFELKRIFAGSIVKAFKTLLEKKHLYQSVRVEKDEFLSSFVPASFVNNEVVLEEGQNDRFNELEPIVDKMIVAHWTPEDPSRRRRVQYAVPDGDPLQSVEFYLESVKTKCGKCAEVSPFNLMKAIDVVSDVWRSDAPVIEAGNQVIVFVFQCQSCREGIETFMVARKEAKLTLTGRFPMERVSVPPSIPKNQDRYYSDAIVAFNSGQILPSLFMLRTFIEQYVRDVMSMSEEKVDPILDSYMDSLPVDFKDRFPSLKGIYSILSVAIHEADESPSLFTDCQEKIDLYFEAKRIYLKSTGLST